MRLQLLPGCLLAGVCFLTGCGRASSPSPKEAAMAESSADAKLRVTPIKPARKTLIRYCEQPGQIAAREEAPLFAKVSGYVRQVNVDIGDKVRGPVYVEGTLKSPGQTLVSIDVPELEQELAQKQASVEQATAEIKQSEAAVKVAKAMADSARAMEDEASAMVERVEAEFARWKAELARIEDLAARQAVTDKLVDETQSKFRAADAMRKEIAAKIRSAQAQLRQAEALVEKAEADQESAQAKRAVTQAERDRVATQISFAEIRAPFDGIVAARHVDAGHLINAGSSAKEPLLVVVSADVVRVSVDVPEVDSVHIEPDAEATIRLPSLGAAGVTSVTGKVARTAWVLNQATRTLRVEIDVPNADGRLRPGMYAHARLKVAERPDAIVVPKTALLVAAGQTSVWRVDADGTLRRQVVQTGIEAGGEWEIVAGLTGDEELIGVNPAAFREGQQIERAEAPAK